MRRLSFAMVLAVGLSGAAGAQEAVVPAAPSLPGGASSVQESFGDWQVICQAGEAGRICLMMQRQNHSQSSQLVLAAELIADASALRGQLVLPFGLRLSEGVRVQVDEEDGWTQVLPFSTCLPQGCLVPLSLDEVFVAALRKGGALNLGLVANTDGAPIALAVSLRGFIAAEARLRELSPN